MASRGHTDRPSVTPMSVRLSGFQVNIRQKELISQLSVRRAATHVHRVVGLNPGQGNGGDRKVLILRLLFAPKLQGRILF